MSLFADQLFNGITTGAIYILLAVSLTFTYKVVGVVQLAQGDVMILGSIAGFYIAQEAVSLPLSITVAAVVCGLIGWLLYDAMFRWLQGKGHLPPLVAGIALSTVIEGLIQIFFYGGQPVHYPAGLISAPPDALSFRLTIIGAAAVVGVGFYLITGHTSLGRALRATADTEDGSRVVGINVQRTKRAGFILGAALAGGAGVLIGIVNQYLTPTSGLELEFIAIACILFGGLGSVVGAAVGGLVLGVGQSLVTTYLSSAYRDAITFGVVLVIVLLRPQGLLGAPQRVRA